jgi:hypothetical protein
MITLTKEEIGVLRILLGRAQLSGQEVASFVAIANKLTEIEDSLTKKRTRGAKDLSPDRQ